MASGQLPPEENCPPVRVRGWVRISFWVGGQFSSGAIVLEPCFIEQIINICIKRLLPKVNICIKRLLPKINSCFYVNLKKCVSMKLTVE